MDKDLISKALGVFFYMVSEAVLGKTRFGSWLGLAKAIVWFSAGTVLGKVTGLFKPSPKGDKEQTDASGNKGN